MSLENMAVTRREVERELEKRSASIAGSILRIRRDLSLPTEPVKSAVREHPLGALLGTMAIGMASGWLVGGSGKKADPPAFRPNGVADDQATSEFLHLVNAGRIAGLSEEDALASALRLRNMPPSHSGRRLGRTLTDRLGDQVIGMAETAVKTALRVVVQEAANWLSEAIKREKPRRSQ